ncbi:hypothetical protein N2605_27255 [Bradyrhizobium yuanmingense]|nr:hypothetical protein [Bradyrhizobium sp. CB1024]UWU83210.1 hypothetical protein N2605_27255 [Bradyrhizobium sp. CB1024]
MKKADLLEGGAEIVSVKSAEAGVGARFPAFWDFAFGRFVIS